MKTRKKSNTANGKAEVNSEPAIPPDPPARESSAARVAANRENAKRSTGPHDTTVTSQNATRHGLSSKRPLIPGETPEEFEEFRQFHLSKLQPRRGIEDLIADQFIITCWRLQRLERIEADAFTRYGLSAQGAVMGASFSMIASIQGDGFLGDLSRYEGGLRRQYFRCLDTLTSMRKSGQFQPFPRPCLDAECVTQKAETVTTQPGTPENASANPAGQTEAVSQNYNHNGNPVTPLVTPRS